MLITRYIEEMLKQVQHDTIASQLAGESFAYRQRVFIAKTRKIIYTTQAPHQYALKYAHCEYVKKSMQWRKKHGYIDT